MKGSSWKKEPQRFEADFLHQLRILQIQLENGTYKTSKGSEFILNERGKIRYVHGSVMRDRVVRHALCDEVLNPAIQPYLIYNNGASQKNKGITFARQMFERDLHNFYLEHRDNEGYVGFVDMSKFYDNIRHQMILDMFQPIIDEFSFNLLEEIINTFAIDVSYMTDEEYECCMDVIFNSIEYHRNISEDEKIGLKYMRKSVDIGDQVSQSIGIYYPTPVDKYATVVRGCKRYGRYMDDIYLMGRDKEYIQSVISGIADKASEIGLFVNMKKTRIVKMSETYKYLQVKYTLSDTGRVIKRINPESLSRERRKLKAYKRLLDKEVLSYDNIEQAYKSWMGSFTKIMSKQQISNMKTLYKELFGKEPSWKPQ